MKRRKVTLSMNIGDLVSLMSEGNPGAITVLMQMIEADTENVFHILSLDDMNIRGSQIWVGYKDFAHQDLNKFIEAIKSRNKEMISVINQECPNHVAVIGRASFERGI